MKRIALSLIAVAVTTPAVAKPVPVQTLERQWLALNEECRGGSHDPEDAVCRRRDSVERALERRGRCWAYRDDAVSPVDYRWHDCRVRRP